MGKAHIPIAGGIVATALPLVLATTIARGESRAPADVFYAALHGDPETVDADQLVAAPGRFVGRAVRTRGRLVAVEAGDSLYELGVGKGRLVLRLEPEAKAVVAARSAAWAGQTVAVEGFFYREAAGGPQASPYALRTWLVSPVTDVPRPAGNRAEVPIVPLQELVYGSGRYDGRLVRVRGIYRGSNRDADLPETTRKGRGDWVIKEGYFAAWVTGRDARGESWDLTQRSSGHTDAVLEVVGVPATSGGVVRIQAREVELSPGFVAAISLPRDAGLQAVSPRVSFAWPIPGEPLLRRGHMVLTFSKPIDPQSLEGRLRVRYAGAGASAPSLTYEYRQRYRALVVTPEPPPPPRGEVVLELLEGIIDVDGRALTPRQPAGQLAAGVIDAVRFRSGP